MPPAHQPKIQENWIVAKYLFLSRKIGVFCLICFVAARRGLAGTGPTPPQKRQGGQAVLSDEPGGWESTRPERSGIGQAAQKYSRLTRQNLFARLPFNGDS